MFIISMNFHVTNYFKTNHHWEMCLCVSHFDNKEMYLNCSKVFHVAKSDE